MKLFLVAFHCAIAALARTAPDGDRKFSVLMFGNERTWRIWPTNKATSYPFLQFNPDSIIVPYDPYLEVQNAREEEFWKKPATSRPKRATGCENAPPGSCDEGCGGGDCQPLSHADKIKQHMSRLEGIKDLLAYKKEMLRKKIAAHMEQTRAALAAKIAAEHKHDVGHGSCCPDLSCCLTREK